jgi:hypothetical protein
LHTITKTRGDVSTMDPTYLWLRRTKSFLNDVTHSSRTCCHLWGKRFLFGNISCSMQMSAGLKYHYFSGFGKFLGHWNIIRKIFFQNFVGLIQYGKKRCKHFTLHQKNKRLVKDSGVL